MSGPRLTDELAHLDHPTPHPYDKAHNHLVWIGAMRTMRSHRRVRQADVARRANVSTAVVSKVLSGRVVYYSDCLMNADPRECPFSPKAGERPEPGHVDTGAKI